MRELWRIVGWRIRLTKMSYKPYNKYRAKPKVVDGIRFASTHEANRYMELKMLLRAGKIKELELQKRLPLAVNSELICHYVCDFVYKPVPWRGEVIWEDAKGVITDVYKLKKKLVKAIYGIDILET